MTTVQTERLNTINQQNPFADYVYMQTDQTFNVDGQKIWLITYAARNHRGEESHVAMLASDSRCKSVIGAKAFYANLKQVAKAAGLRVAAGITASSIEVSH